MLLTYSVHFKSNRGDATSNIGKREEAARQLLTHVAEMERVYSQNAKIVTVIAGDFNTDPTDARFASEETFALLREKFVWSWEKVPLSERVTNPAKGRYPDASFDGVSNQRCSEISPASQSPSKESATISLSCSQSLSTDRTYGFFRKRTQ